MKHYALIGLSLGHSFSREFFTAYFEENQINADYSNLELMEIDQFNAEKLKFDGFNVTIPYKESIVPYLDEMDPVAAEVGAVNTIKIRGNKTIGYNTDVIGFANMIKPFLTNRHERALIFGTGGASKAVQHVLENLGIDCCFVSRESHGENVFSYEDVNDLMVRAFKLIINTTPVGMYPNVDEAQEIPYHSITDEHLVIDLIYNPDKTEFLKRSEEQGATILNGLSMLKEQAIAAYKIWNE